MENKLLQQLLLILFLFFISISFGQTTENNSKNIAIVDSTLSEIIRSSIDDSVKINMISRLAYRYRYAQYTLNAIHKLNEIATNSKDSKLIADANRIFGNYYYFNSNLDSSEYHLLMSKELLSDSNNILLNIQVRNTLSGVYRKKGEISKAIETILESKSILEKSEKLEFNKDLKRKLFSQQIIVNNTLANFYNQMEDYEKAIECYDIAYSKSIEINSLVSAGVIMSNKGDLLLNLNENKKALEVLFKAKELKIEGNSTQVSLANTDQNIALALYKLQEYKKSFEYINKSLSYYKQANIVLGEIESSIIIGMLYLQTDEVDKAIINLSLAKKLSFENRVLENQKKACQYLFEAYEKKGDYKSSLKNHKEFIQARDSIFNSKNIKKITQLEMKYTFDKEKEFRALISKTKEKENNLIIRSLIIGLIALTIIAGLYYRLSYVNKESNKQLTDKNSQITEALDVNKILIKETHHRVKNNLQIITSLLSMQSRFLDDEKSKAIVTDSKNRIKSMSLIHQKLYQENNLTGIETESYFSELIDSLVLSYGIDLSKVSVEKNIEDILLDVDTIIPLGLILNEMISNAFKYGVDKETGIFKFSFSKVSDLELEIVLQDNGPGIPLDFNISQSKSYGMKLIKSLSKKLKSTLDFNSDNGLKITMSIRKFKMS